LVLSRRGVILLAVVVDPKGQFVYVANLSGSNNVSIYSIDPSGMLMPVGAPVSGVNGASGIAVDPTGQFVYVTNVVTNTVAAYGIALTGDLMAIGAPVATGSNPRSVAIDQTSFIYVGNQDANNISAFSISSSGTLTSIGSPVAAGTFPSAIVIVGIGPPTNPDQCKEGNWKRFTIPRSFENQGLCIQFVNVGK
jgi:6-phosphogluconolactonase (cycloisomerase 2 family)